MNEVIESSAEVISHTDFDARNKAMAGFKQEYYLGRPPLLSEYLPDHPKELLKEVFASPSNCDSLKALLTEWLCIMGLLQPDLKEENTPVNYQNGFYKELPELIQAIYGFHKKRRDEAEVNSFRQVIARFCRQFPRLYVQRELWCFLSAALILSGENQLRHAPDKVLEWYEQASCLVEATYLLSNEFACDLVL